MDYRFHRRRKRPGNKPHGQPVQNVGNETAQTFDAPRGQVNGDNRPGNQFFPGFDFGGLALPVALCLALPDSIFQTADFVQHGIAFLFCINDAN